MDYEVVSSAGDSSLTVRLDEGEEFVASLGAIAAKSDSVSIQTGTGQSAALLALRADDGTYPVEIGEWHGAREDAIEETKEKLGVGRDNAIVHLEEQSGGEF